MALPFAVPPGGRALCRQGRVVGRVWETPEAQFCFLAGVQPPDLAATRGEQAVAVFPGLSRSGSPSPASRSVSGQAPSAATVRFDDSASGRPSQILKLGLDGEVEIIRP